MISYRLSLQLENSLYMKYKKERFTSVIQEAAGKYVSEKKFDKAMVTVTSVSLNKDFTSATICISVLPEEQENTVKKKLNRGKGMFAKYVKSKTRIFHIPRFSFVIDEGEKHRQKIDEISMNI